MFTIGQDLVRPECVLTTSGGYLYTSDWRGGVSILAPDGRQLSILAAEESFVLRPNGIALLEDGSFLVCHLGNEEGGVYKLKNDGTLSAFLLELEGENLPPTNFVHVDRTGRAWISVSTRMSPRDKAYRPDVRNGFIAMVDKRGVRVVADGLGYTNEVCVSADGKYLYANETFARRLSRFLIRDGGLLGPRETVTEFGHGTFPDGLAFDEEGAIWITSIVSNRVIRVLADGTQQKVLEDSVLDHVEWVEQAYHSMEMGRPHLDSIKSRKLRNVSSLAFGGADRKIVYLGCLLDSVLYRFESPVAGLKPVHWHFKGPLT